MKFFKSLVDGFKEGMNEATVPPTSIEKTGNAAAQKQVPDSQIPTPSTQTKKTLPKIGILGWIGVVVLLMGAWTFIGARKDAKELIHFSYANPSPGTTGIENSSVSEELAKQAGYNSYEDYLTVENRKSGGWWAFAGTVLLVAGLGARNKNK